MIWYLKTFLLNFPYFEETTLNTPAYITPMSRNIKDTQKTYGGVFDQFTLRTLEILRGQGHFDELVSPICAGKESQVYSAIKGSTWVAVKIYRLETCDFNRMYDYIKRDPRYNALKRIKRQVIFSWVQREFRNIHKAREAGCRVPLPITFKNNVLVESFLGEENQAAPKLKDAILDDANEVLHKLTKDIKKLYDFGLVHGDLSPFNILYHKDMPFLIDLSQGTVKGNPEFLELLHRDIASTLPFFKKRKVVCSQEEIIQTIRAKK